MADGNNAPSLSSLIADGVLDDLIPVLQATLEKARGSETAAKQAVAAAEGIRDRTIREVGERLHASVEAMRTEVDERLARFPTIDPEQIRARTRERLQAAGLLGDNPPAGT